MGSSEVVITCEAVMVASENYQIESETQAETNFIPPGEILDNVLRKMSSFNDTDVESVHSRENSSDNISAMDCFDREPIHNELNKSEQDLNCVESCDAAPIGNGYSSLIEQQIKTVASENNSGRVKSLPVPQVYAKIRRVPSTANPKHRTPMLYKSQKSQSTPQLNSNGAKKSRRGSLPQNSNIANVHPRRNSCPQAMGPVYQELLRQKTLVHQQVYTQTLANQTNTQKSSIPKNTIPVQHSNVSNNRNASERAQQQIVYIQIPNLPQSHGYDSKVLQTQISAQLQQLVPQIYSQLMNQYGNPAVHDLTQRNSTRTNVENSERSKSPSTFSTHSASSSENSFSTQAGEGSNPEIQSHRKKKKSSESNKQRNNGFEIINETPKTSKDTPPAITSSNMYQQHDVPILVQPDQLKDACIDLQHATGIPQITIPLSQELLLQCQQLRDPAFAAYHPRLETIQEEAMSSKRGKMSRVSKSKIFACILTVLSVIVVVVLAGDRTVAVVVITVLFLIFFLGLVGFLYLNSTKTSNRGIIP